MASYVFMRTTINLDDDVLAAAKKYAETRSVGLGKAVSELARRGITAARPTRSMNGLLVVDLPEDSPKVSMEKIKQLEAEQ